jgi:hypothetical protein
MAMNAELLGVLLHTLEKAPEGWQAEAFVGVRAPDPPPSESSDDDSDASESPEGSELSEELGEELLDALRVAAARAAAAKLASMFACLDTACRAAVEKFAPAEERAARMAQAQVTHEMAHALLNDDLGNVRSEAAALLAAWCSVADASAALDGRYNDQASPADKWRAFAREFAQTAKNATACMRGARLAARRRDIVELSSMNAGALPAPLTDEEELQQQAAEAGQPWTTQLIELLQGAPA